MKGLVSIRNRFLGIFTALLILTQSTFAASIFESYPNAIEDTPTKTEVKQEVSYEVRLSYVEVATRTAVSTFLFYWIAKAFTILDAPVIKYQNCKAFFVNAYSFSVYYTHLSALAP